MATHTRFLSWSLVGPIASIAFVLPLVASDWPMHRHDVCRSGATDEQVDATKLALQWSWRSTQPPLTAWAGPARWDAYARVRGQPEMRNYDWAFHVVVVGPQVVFGSSVDDSVRCLDAETGREIWRFMTDGPVRITPAIWNEKVYFGSDDGYAYCVRVDTGKLIWKFSPSELGRKVLNNGRLISFWPVRTGVLVDGGHAYFGASLLPWKPSYLCALDANTGEPGGAGCYVRKFEHATLEGPPAASDSLLVFPQGRVAPALYDRGTGKSRGMLKGGGGSFVILDAADEIVHGPAAEPRRGTIERSGMKSSKPIASYPQGRSIVIRGNVAYMITDREVIVSDWVNKQLLWTQSCDSPHELALAGDTLFVGCDDSVRAYRATDGAEIWSHEVDGRAYGVAVADGHLLISTDTGVIHAFAQDAASPDAPSTNAPSTNAAARPGRAPSKQLASIAKIDDSDLIGRWVFQAPYVSKKQVEDIAGDNDAAIIGPVQLERVNDKQALVLDGVRNTVEIDQDHRRAKLPTQAISAEAWVRVDAGLSWTSFIGAFQDNGQYERGWILGAEGNKLSFAVASEKAKRMTYLKDSKPFVHGRWYHVAGTYDGNQLSLYVDGKLANHTTAQQGLISYPAQAFYEIGAYHDKDENNRLKGAIHEVRVYRRALTGEEIASHYAAMANHFPTTSELVYDGPQTPIAIGPWYEFTKPGQARFQWKTVMASPTQFEYRLDGQWSRVTQDELKRDHEVTISGLKHRRIYEYRVGVPFGEKTGQVFECDTYLNYAPAGVDPDVDGLTATDGATVADRARTVVRRVLQQAKTDRGMALLLGCEDPTLAVALARNSRFQIIAFATNRDAVAAARARLLQENLYGHRVAVYHVDSLDDLPTPGNWANLVISPATMRTGKLPFSSANLVAQLRPDGGVALLGVMGVAAEADATLESGKEIKQAARQKGIDVEVTELAGGWLKVTRSPLAGAGTWTHQYGRADNSAYGGETLSGASESAAFETQWVGRPGPRFKPDRNGRKPAPLSTGGRLFVQGLHRIAALDAYNGNVIWSLDIAQLARFNMPRDCGNWTADREHVYAVVKDLCWKINSATGKVEEFFRVEAPADRETTWEWGYIARVDDVLLGSAVRLGTSFTNFWGGGTEGWYDAKSGAATAKVCSDQLFAKYAQEGGLKWTYREGLIINSSITVADGRVYFVESRNKQLLAEPERRIASRSLWQDQFLVALDLQTGNKVWETAVDTADGVTMFSLAAGAGKLALVVSAANVYHVYAYDAATGKVAWDTQFPWTKDNHGGHMARPAIVDGNLLMRPAGFNIQTGERLERGIPDGGCGSYSCARDTVIFRSGAITMFDRATGRTSRWDRIRPDCWLSVIPAAGMVLAPEGGGGCSCGNWMQTSAGFYPKPRRSGIVPEH